MSLVNLSHVCSHLQNASLARLGLTSIPYTRLHLRLSLLLQKQGFLSQVRLAGPSPPASCFPPGTDNHLITAHPHSQRGQRTPEAALQWAVESGSGGTAEALRQKGFTDAAIEFAMSKSVKNLVQLRKEGWHEVAADFILSHSMKSKEQMQTDGLNDHQIAIIDKYQPTLQECTRVVQKWHGDRNAFETREDEAARLELRPRKPYDAYLRQKLWEEVLRADFDVETLRFFAGENRFLTSRELELEGIDVDVMGLTVSNQPFDAPAPEFAADPHRLEEEGVVTQANRASRRLWLGLKYWDGMPVLRKAKMLSKPTKRIRLNERELGRLVRGKQAGEVKPLTQVGEIMVLNTAMGLMDIRECVERKLGGTALCRIW